ncbi:hypothetical protein GCM10025858_34950 [Alicyclobacillus sacchari]|uniref:site-specific integrase n=1 Tax=Alicyclobacillus sacchari TaxID=392010 RepID=UPI0023EA1F8E|nr:site-specific integrase [Alicyclobacillus sacchari]GMA58992.1 hypothetical protein GCM10025858_34950 [Alicyclobacillus sacchari]
MLLEDWIGRFLDESKAKWSANTLHAYGRDLNRLQTWLAKRAITDVAGLSAREMRSFIADELAGGKSKASVSRQLSCYRSFLRSLSERA